MDTNLRTKSRTDVAEQFGDMAEKGATQSKEALEKMSAAKSKTVADRKRINAHEEHELRYWSHRLGVSSDQLKRAVSKVGVMADDVARELGKSRVHTVGPPDDVA
jgi:hypothetical protein